MAKEIDSN